MSRPKPVVLLRSTDHKTLKTEEILAAEAIYAVYYKDRPINLRSAHSLMNYPGPKYKKTSFSNKGHAFNLAERLNEQFKCTDFKVVELNNGKEIEEE